MGQLGGCSWHADFDARMEVLDMMQPDETSLTGKPARPVPPQWNRSYADLGVVAERGRMIAVRTPDPDKPKSAWPRIWLDADAARHLLDWLPEALEYALEGEPSDA